MAISLPIIDPKYETIYASFLPFSFEIFYVSLAQAMKHKQASQHATQAHLPIDI
jgi:hypothetical protein